LVPTLAAVLASAVVILVSNSFTEPYQKIMFQFFVFGLSLALGVAFLITQSNPVALEAAWQSFVVLTWETRFVVTLIVIAGSYFGAGMYVAAPERTSEAASTESALELFKCPASIDTAVGFEISNNASPDDKVFFEELLNK